MPQPLSEIALFVIEQTSKLAKQHSQRAFDEAGLGITVDQWVLLKVIEENEGLSQQELAEASSRDPASITRTLDILERKNLVQRLALPQNRRQYLIHLTREGRVFIQTHMQMVDALRRQSIAGFAPEELETLLQLLRRIQINMD